VRQRVGSTVRQPRSATTPTSPGKTTQSRCTSTPTTLPTAVYDRWASR